LIRTGQCSLSLDNALLDLPDDPAVTGEIVMYDDLTEVVR
jgi:hypothetical protein